jgi:hypothetical protein
MAVLQITVHLEASSTLDGGFAVFGKVRSYDLREAASAGTGQVVEDLVLAQAWAALTRVGGLRGDDADERARFAVPQVEQVVVGMLALHAVPLAGVPAEVAEVAGEESVCAARYGGRQDVPVL